MSAGTNKERLEQNNVLLEDIKIKIQNLPEAGGEVKLNIFMQETEPVTKDGIWIKSSETYDSVKSSDMVTSDNFIWNTEMTAIPYEFYNGSAVSVGNNIYLFGGSGNATAAYKYDTVTNTYTQLTNIPIPYNFYRGSAVAIGTDVYLFGSYNAARSAYKYDTTTDTYTQLTNIIPYSFYDGSAVVIGTNVYLFGSAYDTDTRQYAYKYDTTMDTYTKLTNIPYAFCYSSAVSVGTDIYLLGSNYGAYNCYKYDTSTDTYTQLTNIPYSFIGSSAVAINTNIYLFGTAASDGTTKRECYKYDTITDTYTEMTVIPYAFYNGSAVLVNNDIYLLGGTDNTTKLSVAKFPSLDFEDKSIIIQNGDNYKTLLIPTSVVNGLKNNFKNVYYYTTEGGLNESINRYYGNGTEWIQIS